MNGQLSDHPLAELIHEISDARLSGVVRLVRERARGAVYFDGGVVVAALSNLRALRLVEVLRRSGVVAEGRLAPLVGEGMSDEQAALVIVRAGLLDEGGLKGLQERRSREVLRELLRWGEGEWSFDQRVRLADSAHGGNLEVSGLLVEAARGLPPGFVASRVREDETLAPAADAPQRLGGVKLMPAEFFVFSRLTEPLRLGELVALGGLSADETRRAVYVLALGGLVARPERVRHLRLEPARPAAQRAATQAPDRQAPQEPPRQTGEPAQTTPPPPPPEPETRGTVEELLARARGATHYDVLGIPRSASADDVKRAYYSHARRLHPDRFRRDADEETRQRTDAAFARIAQAYDTLKDAALRAAYDLKLSKGRL